MNMAPSITVHDFSGTRDDFERYARAFSSSNDQYRGYDELVALVSSMNYDDHTAYEARSDGELVAVAAVRLDGSILMFNVFAVDPEFREIGVGDLLFSEIVTQDKFSHATQYESMALPGDRSTKNFFEQRQGKARLLIVGGPIHH